MTNREYFGGLDFVFVGYDKISHSHLWASIAYDSNSITKCNLMRYPGFARSFELFGFRRTCVGFVESFASGLNPAMTQEDVNKKVLEFNEFLASKQESKTQQKV